MSFPQLGYPQYLSAAGPGAYGAERPGVLAAAAAAAAASSGRPGAAELGAGAGAAAVTSVLGMYAAAGPYAGAPNYSAFLPYAADLSLFSQMGSQYELKDNPGVHPATFAAHSTPAYYPYGQFQYGDPGRPKNATRESTSTLKAWLQEHRKNPYPTKGEKIMLAIITKMTLTQVSTWFANARRRLKKENKMTWAPRNKSEDEDEEEGDGTRAKEESSDKAQEGTETSAEDEGISLQVDSLTDHSCSAESDGEKLPCRAGDPLCESGSECKDKYDELEEEEEEEDEAERDLTLPKPVTSSPLTGVEAPLLSPGPEATPRGGGGGKPLLGSRTSPGAPPPANKPKLWSLAEIATSDLKQPSLGPACAPPGLPAAAAPASSGAPPGGSPYPASPLLGRHLYYTAPFYGSYTNYGNLNAALPGQGLLRYNSAPTAPGEALHTAPKAASDAGKAGAHPLGSHYRPPGGSYEPKKDAGEGCPAVDGGAQPYL